MDLLDGDELFGFSQEFRGEDADGCGAIANFVVLDFGDVDEDLGSGVVEGNGLQDGGSVVGNGDGLIRGGLWTEGKRSALSSPSHYYDQRRILFMPYKHFVS